MEWLRCPVCGGKTRCKLRKNAEPKRFPLFRPKRRRETLIVVSYIMLVGSRHMAVWNPRRGACRQCGTYFIKGRGIHPVNSRPIQSIQKVNINSAF